LERKKEEEKFRRDKEKLEKKVKDKITNLKTSIFLKLKFGINLNNRSQDGFFFYNQNRLIIMQDKLAQSNQLKPEYSGIVGIINIPNSFMSTDKFKQRFIDENEYRKLKQTMFNHLEDYYYLFRQEISRVKKYQNIDLFWNDMGYESYDVDKPDANNAEIRKRVKPYLQCDSCLKFRCVPNRPSDMGRIWPDDTICTHFPNVNCNKPEHIVQFNEITFAGRKYINSNQPVSKKIHHRPIQIVSNLSLISNKDDSILHIKSNSNFQIKTDTCKLKTN
jgi:hypothetical protein